jgi:bifunctional non-homologous end joining protein LigD
MNVDGKHVVVTGVIAGESRATAEAKLIDAGARVQSAVSGKTDLLVVGQNVGRTKTEKAAKLGVQVVTWEELWAATPSSGQNGNAAHTGNHGVGNGRPAGPSGAAVELLVGARTIAPMKAKAGTLDDAAGDGWQFEVKWDGVRCVARVEGGRIRMQSRSAKTEWTTRWPNVAQALASFPDCVLDGELVVFDANGDTFGIPAGTTQVSYVVFDLLEYEGEPLYARPLSERRELLEKLVAAQGERAVQVSPAFDDGETLLAWAAERGIEGIMAKPLRSRYVEGSRTGGWLKIKLRNEQEFVIVGWTPGKNGRTGMIGGLVLAAWEDGELKYVGRCGSRPSDEAELRPLLEQLAAPRCLLAGGVPKEERDATWVEPHLVLQVAFQKWTPDRRLWHPISKGLRHDKDAVDVGFEP